MAAVKGIDPDILSEILVVVANPGIEDGHNHVAGGMQSIPGFRRVNVCIRRAAVLTDIDEAPKQAIEIFGIIGSCGGQAQTVIGFGIFDETAFLIFGDKGANAFPIWDAENLQPKRMGKGADHFGSSLSVQGFHVRTGYTDFGLNQNAVFTIGRSKGGWLCALLSRSGGHTWNEAGQQEQDGKTSAQVNQIRCANQ